jgi:predicted acetyltransferase
MTIELATPSLDHLPSYVAALQRGWSPDNMRLLAATHEELAAIAADPAGFVAGLDDPEAKGGPIKMPDGTSRDRLPGIRRWVWDGELAGSIGLRWQNGTSALPPYVLGHIGYAIVPWKEGRGYATRALALMLPEARARGLDYVDITTNPNNIPSQRVVLANGGVLVERFVKEAAYGGGESLRFRNQL